MGACAFDPALVFYEEGEWASGTAECAARIAAFLDGHDGCTKFERTVIFSGRLMELVMERYPWGAFPAIPSARDLSRVLFDLLQRVRTVDSNATHPAQLAPPTATCDGVADSQIRQAWESMLSSGLQEVGDALVVATWMSAQRTAIGNQLTLTFPGSGQPAAVLPMVWDAPSWAEAIGPLEFLPDLNRCVEVLILSTAALRTRAREAGARHLTWTEQFQADLSELCATDADRLQLLRVLAKLSLGIKDQGLGDEAIPGGRRCRVSISRRLHYREQAGGIYLRRLGQHNLEGID